ncbi:MAG: TSUP family transporter [Planctomycetota bacterium]|jgi:uncharacterized membrane protein YfcA
MPARAATVTSLAYIAPVALAGALLGWRSGHGLRLGLVALAVPAGLAGAFAGNWIKGHISNAQLKVIFGVLMVVVGVRLIAGTLSAGQSPRPAEAAAPAERPPANAQEAPEQ